MTTTLSGGVKTREDHLKRLLIVAAAMLAVGCDRGQEESPPTPDLPDVSLYAFDCGRIEMLDLSVFSREGKFDGRSNSAGDMCFLVRHPDGDLMWDAGLPDGLNAQEDGVTNGPFHLSVPLTLGSQLEAVGVTPAEIEYFSISHSHFDHVGNAALFSGSTFLVDGDERAFMFRDEARADSAGFASVAPLETATTQEFDGDHDVFGDGSVVILATPGHTPGHTSLLVNLVDAGPVLLTGDLYHLADARTERTVPVFNTSPEETLRSMDRFESLASETGARVIMQHSLEDMNALPRSPAPLN